MNPEKREQIFARLQQQNPNPQTELEYRSPFELLIAVLLSAQATDISVNKATRGLFAAADTPAAMLKLGEPAVREHIKTIGLFNTKASNVIKTCRILLESHAGQVPQTREALEALPGVGRKTANVVLNTAFRQIAMAVDTHIFRVSNRTRIAPGKDVIEVEQKLLRMVPKPYLMDAHHWLILHGRYVCVARKPRCVGCVIADLCEYKEKTLAAEVNKSKKTRSTGRKRSRNIVKSIREKSNVKAEAGRVAVSDLKVDARKAGKKKTAKKKDD